MELQSLDLVPHSKIADGGDSKCDQQSCYVMQVMQVDQSDISEETKSIKVDLWNY
jgi:hypothetical protein